MPKIQGRPDTRPQLREINLELVVDSWRISWQEWERPTPCSLEGCDHRPEIGERWAQVCYGDALDRVARGTLPYSKLVVYVLCEQHEQQLSRLWDEHQEKQAEALDNG